MGAFVDFLVNNYIIFLVIALILIFALIGYLVESKKRKERGYAPEPEVEKEPDVGSLEELKQGLEGKSLNQAVDKMKSESAASDIVAASNSMPEAAKEIPKTVSTGELPSLENNINSNNLSTDGLGSIPKAPVATPTEFDQPEVPSLENNSNNNQVQ